MEHASFHISDIAFSLVLVLLVKGGRDGLCAILLDRAVHLYPVCERTLSESRVFGFLLRLQSPRVQVCSGFPCEEEYTNENALEGE